MDLILWRHAEAEDAGAGGDDLARALTSRGERQAARMAQWLNGRLPENALILASPATRAQQTVQALERKFRTIDAIGPGAGPDAVLTAARWPDADRAVVVVGHQPTLGLVAARLLGAPMQSLRIRKGGLWWLRQRLRDDEVIVHAVVAPDLM